MVEYVPSVSTARGGVSHYELYHTAPLSPHTLSASTTRAYNYVTRTNLGIQARGKIVTERIVNRE